ncbi:MAG: rhodanese-like domain-containing protein [Cyclobacteriaceae bacterium]|jgi:phage shock protein E|nr:rhodanese-like domain-containing protein [Cyclobacteriaceae bacterium]
MIEALKSLLGLGPKVDYAELVKKGAIVLDVRTKGEYSSGHIRGSLNIPVDQLNNNTNRFTDKNKVIITCCASGMRSGAAKSMLKSKGYTQVFNGGSWMSLQNKI